MSTTILHYTDTRLNDWSFCVPTDKIQEVANNLRRVRIFAKSIVLTADDMPGTRAVNATQNYLYSRAVDVAVLAIGAIARSYAINCEFSELVEIGRMYPAPVGEISEAKEVVEI